jgi:hypothetical protein
VWPACLPATLRTTDLQEAAISVIGAAGLSFGLSSHLASLGATGPHSLDKVPDLSCQDSTRRHAVDDHQLSCKPLVGTGG